MIKFFQIIFLALVSFNLHASKSSGSSKVSKYPYPYCTLTRVLPYNSHSFYHNEKEFTQLIKERKAKVIIELGCWLGNSTISMARNLPKEGKIYAVDNWLDNEDYYKWYRATVAKKFASTTTYEQFLSNVIRARQTDKIIPLRMNTLEAISLFKEENIVPDLVYVDADHSEEGAYQDLVAYFPLVKGHGLLCVDDWDFQDVQKAVKRFAEENNLLIFLSSWNEDSQNYKFCVLYEQMP